MTTTQPAPVRTDHAMNQPTIAAGDLVKTLRNNIRTLNGLNFDVEAGTIFALRRGCRLPKPSNNRQCRDRRVALLHFPVACVRSDP